MNFKLAVILHGKFGNSQDPVAGEKGFEYLNSLILEPFLPDVYIHTWDQEKEDFLKGAYRPKKITTEPQKTFSEELAQLDEDYFNEGFNRASSMYRSCSLFATLSFLYSRKQAIKLLTEEDYDCVLVSRLDAGQRGGQDVRQIRFYPEKDMSFIYSSMWNQLNAGYADMWFYSNKENIATLASAYDIALRAFKKDSEYEKLVTLGWPDSREFNNNSTTDPNQFTNEFLKPQEHKSTKLMKYPRWQVINNHLFYKYFFIASGLYNKSVFV